MRQVEFRASLSRSEFKRLGQNKSSAGWIAGAAVAALAWVFSAVGLGPAQLDFGTRQVGLSSGLPVQLTNRGLTEFHAASIAITGADARDFEIPQQPCVTVSAGESCVVWVNFRPHEAGEKHAQLIVRTADGSELSSEFKGVATAGPAKADPPKQAEIPEPAKPGQQPDNRIAAIEPDPAAAPDDRQPTPEKSPEKIDPETVTPPVQSRPGGSQPPEVPYVPPQSNPAGPHVPRPKPTPAPQQYAHVTMSPGGANFSATSADGEFFNATAQTITVTSDGTADIRRLRLALGDGASSFSVTPACPVHLVRGQRCSVQVRFVPRNTQTRDDSLIAYDGAVRLEAVPLHGSVTGAAAGRAHVSFKPAQVQFPVSRSDGWVTLTQNVVVISDGTADVQRFALNVGPPGGPFSLPGRCPPRLARGQTCMLQVHFEQKSQRQYIGTMTAYDGSTELAAVPLRGGGAPTAGHPRLSVSPGGLKFGGSLQAAMAYVPAGQNVSARNDGDVDLRALKWTIVPAGSPFSQRTNCSNVLARGQGCTVQVGFSASAAGQYQSTLVASEGGMQLATVQLYGSAGGGTQQKPPGGYVKGSVARAYPNNTGGQGSGTNGASQGNAGSSGNPPAKNSGQNAGYRQVVPNRTAGAEMQRAQAPPRSVTPRPPVKKQAPPPQIH